MHVIGYAFVMSLVTARSDRGTDRSRFEREEGGGIARDEGEAGWTTNPSLNGTALRLCDSGLGPWG